MLWLRRVTYVNGFPLLIFLSVVVPYWLFAARAVQYAENYAQMCTITRMRAIQEPPHVLKQDTRILRICVQVEPAEKVP